VALLTLTAVIVSCASGTGVGVGRVISYRGLRIAVPSSWPVYDLARRPHACVRFDRHALYLGQPGSAEDCPAHAVGRTEAILVQPLRDPAAHAGVRITATWDHYPGLVRRALGALPPDHPAVPAAIRLRAPSADGGAIFTGLGFDACAAPSLEQMTAWQSSPYHAVGIYIGGENRGCGQVNLTPSWVSGVAAAGWHLIPIYVGLQAPGACGCTSISASGAAAQGAADAAFAVQDAQALGIGPGNPIYDDMEGYPRRGNTTASVLAFLSAWTAQLHAEGYSSGVYSSADSGVRDLVAQWGTGYAEPDDIWFARWNDIQSTSDSSLPVGGWANHQRLHQYSGIHGATYGGVRLNVDSDYLDGATAGAGCQFVDGTFVQVANVPGVYRIAGCAPLWVGDPTLLAGAQVLTITQQQFDALLPVPEDGTFLQTTTGAFYRVAGGAPLPLTDWSLFGGEQPSVLIDQWDIDNITNPLAHLSPLPANGTFLTTTSGQLYRVAGGTPFRIYKSSVFGHAQPSVKIDQWDIDNISNPATHLRPTPVDGTVVEGLPSRWFWSFAGGWRYRAPWTPQAISVDDVGVQPFAGLTALPIPQCVVPTLLGRTIQAARNAIVRALCAVGKVHRPRRRRRHKLRVHWQIPAAGQAFPEGHRVGLRLR
jgi:hypothetical protein